MQELESYVLSPIYQKRADDIRWKARAERQQFIQRGCVAALNFLASQKTKLRQLC
jgi:hypothetical protein